MNTLTDTETNGMAIGSWETGITSVTISGIIVLTGSQNCSDISNLTNSPQISKIFKNNLNNPNTAPTAPTNLSSQVSYTTVTLSWSAASDAETISSTGLNYNLRVGTTPGGCEIVSPMSFASGKRLLSERGDIQGLFYNLRYLSQATYYWTVQAIDTGFKGGAFAVE